jgi:hypothetical protein
MTAQEVAESKALAYIKGGMDPDQACTRACDEVRALQVSNGLGDFASGWDTFTTYAPWIGAGLAAWWLYSTGKKVKRASGEYFEKKRRQARAAKAAWDASA